MLDLNPIAIVFYKEPPQSQLLDKSQKDFFYDSPTRLYMDLLLLLSDIIEVQSISDAEKPKMCSYINPIV